MSLQMPSRPEFLHSENPEMQGQWERPYKYLVLKGVNVPNSTHFSDSESCSFLTTLKNNSQDLQVQIEDLREM